MEAALEMYENGVYDTDDDGSVIEVEGPAKPPAPVITLRGESEDEDEAGGQQQQQQQQQGGGGGDGHAHVQQMGEEEEGTTQMSSRSGRSISTT